MQQVLENDNETIPTVFSFTVLKIEQTAKSARITVHVNANNGLEAWSGQLTFTATKFQLKLAKEIVAPVEIKS